MNDEQLYVPVVLGSDGSGDTVAAVSGVATIESNKAAPK
jgi:hypothetical protein